MDMVRMIWMTYPIIILEMTLTHYQEVDYTLQYDHQCLRVNVGEKFREAL